MDVVNPFASFSGTLHLAICGAKFREIQPQDFFFPVQQQNSFQHHLLCRIHSLDPDVSNANLTTHVADVPHGQSDVIWNDDFDIVIDSAAHSKLTFVLQDMEPPSPVRLGSYTLDVAALPVDKEIDQWVDMDNNAGKLHFRMIFNPASAMPPEFKKDNTRKVTNLRLILPKTEYMVHETIEGEVEMNVGNWFQFPAPVEVKFIGYEYVRWHEGEGAERKTLSGHTIVYQQVVTIEQTRNISVLQGQHKWKFSIQTPAMMPPTVRTNYGKIEYYIEARIPGQFADRKYLNMWVPVRVSDKVKGRPNELTFSQNNVKLTVWTEQRLVFVHDQPLVINLHLEIDNTSKSDLTSVQVMVVRKSKFRADEDAFISQPVILFKKTQEDIIPAKSWVSQEHLLSLPEGYRQQSVTSDVGAKRISIKHWVVVVVKKATTIGPSKKITLELPIYIGEHRQDHTKTKDLDHSPVSFPADDLTPKRLDISLDQIHL